jgi:lysozyme
MTHDMNKLIAMLKKHEGFRSKPYKDTVGKLTIGYGRNLDDVGISKEEADYLLRSDIAKAAFQLNQQLWVKPLNGPRKAVLLMMVFNMGMNGFLEFKNTIEHIKKGEFADAAKHMLDSKWAKQVGKRADELAKIMETGRFPLTGV